MVVAHNLTAMNSQRQYGITRREKAKSTEKLASGYRINRAADDAAGLAISEKMRRQIRGLNQGADNIKDGISMVQVADGALSEVHDMLNRVTELSVKAANGTLTVNDRSYIQSEISGIINEIQRIADTTTFNEVNLFNDIEYYEAKDQPITAMLNCSSADYGRLHESYEKNGLYYPAAYVNFSGINASNINRLNGGNFSFCCSASCNEVFDITFTTDGTASSATNLSGKVRHEYSVDISKCKNGADIVNTIYKYVSKNLPSTATGTSALGEGVKVSHTNSLIKSGSSLIVAKNYGGYTQESNAIKAYENLPDSSNSGKITCSTIEAEHHDDYRDFRIQCSSDVEDFEEVLIYRMNTNILKIDTLNVSTLNGAKGAIDSAKAASAKLSFQRSILGAQQNRLEHSLRINQNVSENTSAAESAIRDTDMAKETVRNSLLGILEEAGVSMMGQANQSNQTVLSLLR